MTAAMSRAPAAMASDMSGPVCRLETHSTCQPRGANSCSSNPRWRRTIEGRFNGMGLYETLTVRSVPAGGVTKVTTNNRPVSMNRKVLTKSHSFLNIGA